MTVTHAPAGPVFTAALFALLHASLVDLLLALPADDWGRPTHAGTWTVRDVAAHLLDGDLRKLSFHRDGHPPPVPEHPIDGDMSLLAFLNTLNADWVATTRRLSPRVLVDLLDWSGPRVAAFVESLDPFGQAIFPVTWAGEETSTHWMDTGREYTERWHHQQQIRQTVGAPGLVERRWLHPVLDVSLRALPFAYSTAWPRDHRTVVVEVTGEAGRVWSVVGGDEGWRLWVGEAQAPDARLVVDADTLWRTFFKAIAPEVALEQAHIEGDRELGRRALSALAVMA